MKNLFAVILNLSIICVASGTSHSASYWANSYGGAEFDTATSILQTSDGGYIVVGGTNSFGVYGQAGLVLKLDEVGDVVWRRVIDISTTSYDSFYSVLQTSDGGYILAGATYLENSPLILKLNASGNIVWNKLYQRVYGQDERPKSIQLISGGGYIVAGSTYYDTGDWDIWVMELDASGNISWRRTYRSPKMLNIGSIQQTHDGGFVIVGYVRPEATSGDYSAFIAKLDIYGFPVWGREFGYDDDEVQIAYTVIQTPDDGYLVAGSAVDFGVWVVKLGSTGNITHWQKGYGDGNAPRSIQLTSYGDYILTGSTHISGSNYDTYALKINSNGDPLWKRLYGGENNEGYKICIQETTDLGYVIAGDLRYNSGDDLSDMMVVKTDNLGEIPGCNIIRTGTVTATNSDVPSNYFFLPNPPDSVTPTVVTDVSITSQQPSVEKTILCSLIHDSDEDGISDADDNCPDTFNPNQDDTMPPGGNDCGDACECEGNFDGNDNVDGTDASSFKNDFGRGGYNSPCTDANPCNGDFDCDDNVDGSDASIFKADFGRGGYNNPCPSCPTDPWCDYLE